MTEKQEDTAVDKDSNSTGELTEDDAEIMYAHRWFLKEDVQSAVEKAIEKPDAYMIWDTEHGEVRNVYSSKEACPDPEEHSWVLIFPLHSEKSIKEAFEAVKPEKDQGDQQ